MNSNRDLLLFTSAFPYGTGEQFILTELAFLSEQFRRIFIFPYYYANNQEGRMNLPSNVRVFEPFRNQSHTLAKLLTRGIFNTKTIWPYLADLWYKPGILLDARKLSLWFRSLLHCRMILNDKNLNDCIAQSGKNALFYFYWGHRPSGIAAGLKKPGRVIVARFHRVDLYEELFENRGYIPFQKLVLDSLTEAIFVSEHGAGYVKGKYPGLKTPVSVHRLGSFNDGSLGLWQTADSIRVISCSLVDENKRVQLIAQALSHLTIPVSWVHIGEGPLLNKIREYCAQNKNDQFVFEFTGRIANENLHEIYKKRPFDLFVNVSSSEGVPFSIMEALSYGVPVIATAVGGTAEIVDDSCGKILPGQLSAADLMAAINEFYETGFNEKMKMRQEARNKWEKMCDAKTNLRNFLSFLTQIQN